MTRLHKRGLFLTALTAPTLWGATALAQDPPPELELKTEEVVGAVPEADADAEEETRRQGTTGRLSLGATLNFSDNQSVVGQTDGSTFSFGFKLDSGVDYNHLAHEWRNTLLIQEAVTKTPVVEELVKSADIIDLESIYLYHIAKWWGPFVRAGLATQAFRGDDVRPENTTYTIARLNGTEEQVITDRLTLTDPFQPFKLKESLGLFLRPFDKPEFNLEFRGGLGSRQILAENQLALNDDEDTADIVEVKELDDSYVVGGEAAVEVWGDIYQNKVAYRAGAELLIPFATSDLPPGDDRSLVELTNVEIATGLSFKLVEWASLDYEFRAVREPLLVDMFQIQNNLLLTFGIAYGPDDDAPAE